MTGDTQQTLNELANLARQKRIPRALLMGIPYIGSSLAELLFGDDIPGLIAILEAQSAEHKAEILDEFRRILTENGETFSPIMVFGSGNGERVLICQGSLHIGEKQLVSSEELVGGGGR